MIVRKNKTKPIGITVILIVLAYSSILLGLRTPTTPEYRNALANDIIWYSCQSLSNNGSTDDGENYSAAETLSFTNQPDAVGNYMMLTFPAEHATIEQIHILANCTMSNTGNVSWTGWLKSIDCDATTDGDAINANSTIEEYLSVTKTSVATTTWRRITFDIDPDESDIKENVELWQFKWYISTAGNCTAVGVEFGS